MKCFLFFNHLANRLVKLVELGEGRNIGEVGLDFVRGAEEEAGFACLNHGEVVVAVA